jgi:hypothetical protein
MSLTGQTFQWLTMAIAVVATIAVVLLWNKIRGPRPVRVAGRASMLVIGYLTTAVAILVSINIAYGGLIASWGDLFDNLQSPHGNWNQHHHGHGHHQPFVWPTDLPSPAPTESTPPAVAGPR